MYSQFVGTGVALVTPFDNTGAVDYEALRKIIHHVSDNKVEYLVVNGTTAESATTNEVEKSEILKFIIAENQGKLPIMYGLGGNNTQELVEKIQGMNFEGIHAILSVSPYYNKPSQEGIYQHYKVISEVCPVPVVLYNVPSRTGSNIAPQTTIRLAQLPNIIGIKDANTDIGHCLEVLSGVSKDFLFISGDDMWAVPLIAVGGKGAISVLANAYPLQFSTLIRDALDNHFDKATVLLKSFSKLNPLLYEEGNPVGIKTVLHEMGLASLQTRLPLANASEVLQRKIRLAMQGL